MLWKQIRRRYPLFYDRDYIAERLKGLETELSLECRITLNGEERWVRNVVIRGEIEDSEYAMIFLRDITEAKVESARHLQMAADNGFHGAADSEYRTSG